MSDEDSDCEVPVCGSFEPQVWRKGYCRNCFHPGNKHQGGNLIIEDDKRKFVKDNIHKKTDKSSHDTNDKVQSLKKTDQEFGKTVKDKISDKAHDRQSDKDKLSFKDRFEKLQKDKSNQDEKGSTRKIGPDKLGVDKKPIPDKLDSSKNIPPPVAPKTKGLDKLKSKSTSDIREEIKSPVGNKLFKQIAQNDTIDKSKSKFGSAENVSNIDKKVEGITRLKSGSAENLTADKQGSSKKSDKTKTDSSETSKPDYRNLLSGKGSKPEDKSKEKSSVETRDKANKLDKDTNSDTGKMKLDIGANKKDSPNKLFAQLKSPSSSEKSPLLEKDKPDFKAKFDKPELKSSKKDDRGRNEKIDTNEKPQLKSVHDSEKKNETLETEKPELKSTQKKKKDDAEKLEKLEFQSSSDKDKKGDKSKNETPELKSVQDKEKKDEKTKYEKPELKSVQDTEKREEKSKHEKPELKSVQDKEKVDCKSKFEKPELKTVQVQDKEKKDEKSKYEKPELKSVQDKEKKEEKPKYEKPELKSAQDKEKKDVKAIYEKPEPKSVQDKEKKDEKAKFERPQLKKTEEKDKTDHKAKFEKPGLNKVEEKEKVDFKTKYEKPGLKKVDEPVKRDFKSKYEKPELNKVEEKEKADFHLKLDKPELKKVEEKDKKDYKSNYEKPELKTVEEKEKKDYRAKFNKPELKSSKAEDKKKDEKDDLKKKSSIGDRITGLRASQDKSSVKDESISVKGKWKPKSPSEEKDKFKTEGVKTDLKAGLKSVKTDDKDKTSLTSGKGEGSQEKDKNKSSPASKWLGSLDKDKTKDTKTDNQKSKSDKFQLKSVKNEEKVKDKSVFTVNDLKSKSVKDDKVDLKKGLFDNKKAKTEETEKDSKTKLEQSSLKSAKTDETEKKDFKAKFEKPQLKSTKSDEKESAHTPKANDITGDNKKKDVNLTENFPKEEDRETIENELNLRAEIESSKQKSDQLNIKDKNANLKLLDTDTLKQKSQVNEKNISPDTSGVKSVPPANYLQKSDNLSSDADTDIDEPDNACALTSKRGKSPVHVDTQVFTSSRNKSAGVEGTESDLFTTQPQKGLSGSLSSDNFTENQKREASEEKGTLKHDELSDNIAPKTSKEGIQDDNKKRGVENDVDKLKKELLKMAEKCEKLEEENESLKHGLSTKESDHSELEKQKHEVEGLILGLQDQLKSMEDRCVKMESENSNLMASLKKQEETSKSQPATEESEETEDGIRYTESMVEDLIEQNEDLKQEIQDLKVEMEEMYDSFRDQEAEEFRELQKELEITAKNCRILQFKMRKAERRNEQLEDDRNLFEDKLRILQNQFENKDAVAHIKTLEQELKMAKDVSVRLHDELDMMDDKRSKVEEENRHLTDLLEQADRKQFRLEIEVDKLRDQIVDLRQRLAAATSDDPDNPPRKINCAEFLALHRDII